MSCKNTSYAKERYCQSIEKAFSLHSCLAVMIVSKKTCCGRAVNTHHGLSIIYSLLYELYSAVIVLSNAIFFINYFKRENVREQSLWAPLSSIFINSPCILIMLLLSILSKIMMKLNNNIFFITLPMCYEHSVTYYLAEMATILCQSLHLLLLIIVIYYSYQSRDFSVH